MRTNLSVEDLGTFLDEPRVAVLATVRFDGTVLLSPSTTNGARAHSTDGRVIEGWEHYRDLYAWDEFWS